MSWIDEGFLISKNRYSENSLIAEIFTKNRGKISGIIFGGTSKKIKNYLQIGNRLHINYSSKSENRIGYFKVEILNAYSPLYFDHKQKLSCITSATNLIKILTADSQSNIKVYQLIENLFFIFFEVPPKIIPDIFPLSLVKNSVINEFSLYLFLLIKKPSSIQFIFNHFILFKHSIAAFCSASFLDLPDPIKYFVLGSLTPTLKDGL